MIINLRGTSGAGKSTVVRRVRDLLDEPWEPIYIEGRRKPYYYLEEKYKLCTLGHYESQCGGCDTISGNEKLYELILERHHAGYHVLCEGILLSEDTKWTFKLHEAKVPLWIIFLHVDLETCLTRIRQRRLDRGDTKPLNPKNTTNRFSVIKRARVKLEAAGVSCRALGCDQAPKVISRWLKE